MSSVLKNTDWYQELEEYTPDNRIVELLEEDTEENLEVFGYNSDTFDGDTFSIWCDI